MVLVLRGAGRVGRCLVFSFGSSRECVHGLRERQVSHAVVEVAYVVLWGAESVGLVADHLCFVVEALHSSVADGHVKVVQ